uniref:NADH-ubiquinone oxidoreductase chain 4 n=1 Tax=Pseudanoplocephala crawfordi TaxID=1480107 RepID=A0A0U2PDV9_9CEST|nr:NADH dehydrogenase subunit 4 [Pseudanoplocephala crawfordi]ALJ78644.1 NADH dehydrogenase subunit 4 [Pseudanoplocephala crawfordi]
MNFFLVSFMFYGFLLLLGPGALALSSDYTVVSNYFVFDSISFYLILLILLLGVVSQLSFSTYLSLSVCFYLFLSIFFSVASFCVNHSIIFWCFYELSMLPLLYLIFKESPYSERFLAGWYFACYLLVTSLPLVLLLLYLCASNNSCFFNDWSKNSVGLWVFIVLSFVFFTKVPLTPFHTWLPIVHAEAASIVSIFLSGYIMKLGILGVYRCSCFIFDDYLFGYLFICLVLSIFFLITATSELDGKRWLAFLSLAHITIPLFAFFISDYGDINYSFYYCVGHGLSAGLVFGLLWYFYDVSNSRNWLLLKSSINCSSIMILVITCLLSLCSLPPTIQFFCEVSLIKISANFLVYLLFWGVYLFLGGLVPLVMCGHLLIRSEWNEIWECSKFNYFNFLIILCFWCYVGLIVV